MPDLLAREEYQAIATPFGGDKLSGFGGRDNSMRGWIRPPQQDARYFRKTTVHGAIAENAQGTRLQP